MNDLPVPSPSPKQSSFSREENQTDSSGSAGGGTFKAGEPVSLRNESAEASRSATKPIAAFLLPEVSLDAVYGIAERAELDELLTFVDPASDVLGQGDSAANFSNVEALFTGWYSPSLDNEMLARFPSLRIVFHAGGSVKSLVTDDFWNRGLRLTCTARANAIPVAEYTIASIVLSLKHVWASARTTREARRFVRNDAAVPSCYGSVVGIISLGLIGRLVVERLRHFDVEIICHDPYLSAGDALTLGVKACSLEELCARADVVSCHTPLLAETTHLLRERHFASMKPGAAFINTARGGIVHEPEMLAVLQRRPDLFAVLDVTDPEPPVENSLLYTLPNVLLTPHIAGSIGPECHRMGRMIIDEVRRYRAGAPLMGEVLREQLPLLA